MILVKFLIVRFIIVSFLIIAINCNDNRYIKKQKVYKDSSISQNLNEEYENRLGFSWEKPSSWINSDLGSMRDASFKVPYSEGSGDLSVMVLYQDGGGLEANINRWRNQINLGSQTENEIKESAESRSNKIGFYSYFKILNDQWPSSAFLTAIMPLKESTIFVKLNIPKKGIKEVEKDFKYFCDSFSSKVML